MSSPSKAFLIIILAHLTLQCACTHPIRLYFGIRLLLVSTLMINNYIYGPSTSSTNSCADLSTKSTLLQPYMSQYDHLYKNNNGTQQNKGRKVLTATLKTSFTAPFTSESWDAIYELSADSQNLRDQGSNKINDVLLIHTCVTSLILSRVYDYVTNDGNINNIQQYLGFDSKTVELINIAITVLTSQERKGNINLATLLKFFYYSCDVESVLTGSIEKRSSDVMDAFKYTISIQDMSLIVNAEELFKSNLISILQSFSEKIIPSFGVSISSMKMKILKNKTANPLIKTIKNLNASILDTNYTIQDYVEKYALETDAEKVNSFHLSILSVLITNVFGYVYNYFQILIPLRKFEIKDEDREVIESFSTIMNSYISIFIDRYFEFKGEISQNLVDAMLSIKNFLLPIDPQITDGRDFTEIEISTFNISEVPEFSLPNYYNKFCLEGTFETKMKELIDNAVDELTKTFVGTVEDTPLLINRWDQWINMPSDNDLRNKKNLLKLMQKNYKDAASILKEFSCEFSIQNNIYDSN